MMKITTVDDEEQITVVLVGQLTKEWVNELLKFWQEAIVSQSRRVECIDLTGVTFIDDAGKALLALLYRDGARLMASGLLTKAIVEEITSR